MRTLAVWGAGRIGRGFVAPIFLEGGWRVVFVDKDGALVDSLNGRKGYTILRAKREGVTRQRIEGGFSAIHTSDAAALDALFMTDDFMLDIAVHEPKLAEVADMLAPLFTSRARARKPSMDVMMNVNMASPDEAFVRLMEARLTGEALDYFREKVGVTGIAAMCISPVAPEAELIKDPLTLINNDYPEQAIGVTCLKAEPPALPRLRLTRDVRAEETRKLYTLNMAHALCCYIGVKKGYATVIEAMGDKALRETVNKALLEAVFGLRRAYGFDEETMAAWPERIFSLLDNPYINDNLPRLGADTRRKLAYSDRLVGPARLCLEAGGTPRAIPLAVRAGFDFRHDDPGTAFVRGLVESEGLKSAVSAVCGLSPDSALFDAILSAKAD